MSEQQLWAVFDMNDCILAATVRHAAGASWDTAEMVKWKRKDELKEMGYTCKPVRVVPVEGSE